MDLWWNNMAGISGKHLSYSHKNSNPDEAFYQKEKESRQANFFKIPDCFSIHGIQNKDKKLRFKNSV